MPTYTFLNTLTNEEWTEIMSIAERDQLLLEKPHIEQALSAPGIVSGMGTFGHKKRPDEGFRDKLREIKKAHPRSTIDVK